MPPDSHAAATHAAPSPWTTAEAAPAAPPAPSFWRGLGFALAAAVPLWGLIVMGLRALF